MFIRVSGGPEGRWWVIELNGDRALSSTAMIAAFEGGTMQVKPPAGWSIIWAWRGTPPRYAIDPEDDYDFQVDRAVMKGSEGRTDGWSRRPRGWLWPIRTAWAVTSSLVTASSPICAGGLQRRAGARSFTDLGAQTVVLLGALLADSPHTRPVPVATAASDPARPATCTSSRWSTRGRRGSSGLQHACAQAGIATVSLWASVPHYVAQPPSPKATWPCSGGGGCPGRVAAAG